MPRPPAACVYDASAEIDLLPAIERTSVLARGTWRWNANTDLFAEALFSRNRFETTIAPTPISSITVVGPNVYPAGGPYYPTAWAAANGVTGNLSLLYRAAELGPRITDTDSEAQRYVLGVEGLAGGWDYNVAAVYSRNTQSTDFKSGFVYVDRLIPAMATGLINPFGASGPDGQALLASTQFYGTPLLRGGHDIADQCGGLAGDRRTSGRRARACARSGGATGETGQYVGAGAGVGFFGS